MDIKPKVTPETLMHGILHNKYEKCINTRNLGYSKDESRIIEGIDIVRATDQVIVIMMIQMIEKGELALTIEQKWKLAFWLLHTENPDKRFSEQEISNSVSYGFLIQFANWAEHHPQEIRVGDFIVSLPYSLYALIAKFHGIHQDQQELKLWVQYGQDRIESFQPDLPSTRKSRIMNMLSGIQEVFPAEFGIHPPFVSQIHTDGEVIKGQFLQEG